MLMMMMMMVMMTWSSNTFFDKKDHVQYLTVSKSYSDDCTCSLTKQNREIHDLCYGAMILYLADNTL